ncbi:MAG TPA: hypothetical protein VFE37_21005 [Chloroflexota bacterium]|nr:hypothetical protein [Chloroflexota bacterium]
MDPDCIEQSGADAAPAEPADADAGVPAPPQPPSAPGPEPAPVPEAVGPTAGDAPARRALKLVVSLQPGNAVGYRALIALGADGCDPLLRTADVADLAGALDEVAGLLAEAEGRWELQPRYPAAMPAQTRPAGSSRAPAPPHRPPRGERPATAAEPQPAPTLTPPHASAAPHSPPASSPADQLTLFS